ncbi:MAG: Tol-Pal system beta propeller repeat protein TolB [Azospirillaceae bacterium]
MTTAQGQPIRLLGLLLALLFAVAIRPAAAQVIIDVTDPNVEPVPIAISGFAGGNNQFAQDIPQVITDNLQRSGLFAPVSQASFIQGPQDAWASTRFGDWRVVGAEFLASGEALILGDGRLQVRFRLWDVINESQEIGVEYTADPENWRRIAHQISDAIYSSIIGEQGYFDTRIVYIAESGPPDARVKRLAIMDQDGANNRFLTDGETLVLTPRFSPTSQEITYLGYYNNRPRVYLFNIDTGRQEVLGDFPGMTFAPRFSPDGNSVVFSFADNGNSDIYLMDLRTRQQRRLTSDPGIDTGASFSPDGSRIVFESDRGGSQQLYTMNADGTNVQRISFGDGRYGSPVWSPRGDLVAFTSIRGGQFAIGVMRPDGTGERILATGYSVEGPTWAPNGRVLMYFSTAPSGAGGQSRLHVVDLSGQRTWTVPLPHGGSDPAWSPLIP